MNKRLRHKSKSSAEKSSHAWHVAMFAEQPSRRSVSRADKRRPRSWSSKSALGSSTRSDAFADRYAQSDTSVGFSSLVSKEFIDRLHRTGTRRRRVVVEQHDSATDPGADRRIRTPLARCDTDRHRHEQSKSDAGSLHAKCPKTIQDEIEMEIQATTRLRLSATAAGLVSEKSNSS